MMHICAKCIFRQGHYRHLTIYAFNMTDKVDDRGYFILDKHALVTMTIDGICSAELKDSDLMPGIISDLEISKVGDVYQDSSYGIYGALTAKKLSLSIVPGKAE